MHNPAENEDACSELQENVKKPRKRIVIEMKKTTTTTTTTRKELLVNDSDISMSYIQALMDQTCTDAIPVIDNVDVKEEINTNLRQSDDTEPLFSSTKLNDLQQSSEETQQLDCPNLVKTSSKKDTLDIAPKKRSNVSTNIIQNSRASSVDQSNKRYPARETRATRATVSMAKIATKKSPKRKSSIDALVNMYSSMAKNPKPNKEIKPVQTPKPQPQTQPAMSHELSAIFESPDETIESIELNNEEPSNHSLLEPKCSDENAEHNTETYMPEKAELVHKDTQKLSRIAPKAAGNIKKQNKSSRASKSKKASLIAKNLKIKEALAKLPKDKDDSLVSVVKRSPLKPISEDKVRGSNRNDNKKRRSDPKMDEKKTITSKMPATVEDANSIASLDAAPEAELLEDLFEPNVDDLEQLPNITPEKKKSIPKERNADNCNGSKKSHRNSKDFSGHINKPLKAKQKVSVAKQIVVPPNGPKRDIRSRLMKELDSKSIKIYSPSRRNNFETVNGNHVMISKEAIEKALTDNCKTSKHVLKQFEAHDIEVEDNTRLLILPAERDIRPSKKSEANVDPMSLGRQRRTQTLIIRERD